MRQLTELYFSSPSRTYEREFAHQANVSEFTIQCDAETLHQGDQEEETLESWICEGLQEKLIEIDEMLMSHPTVDDAIWKKLRLSLHQLKGDIMTFGSSGEVLAIVAILTSIEGSTAPACFCEIWQDVRGRIVKVTEDT